jgi:hypothetical protein
MTSKYKINEMTFADYISHTYKHQVVDSIEYHNNKDIFDEEHIEDTTTNSSILVQTCQGCIDGQPNQEAHINWGGCLSIYNESTTVEDDSDTESYCSTTSYESDGENATPVEPEQEPHTQQLQLNLSASSIMMRRGGK